MGTSRLSITITGESMRPLIKSGESIVIDLKAADLKVGNLLFFKDLISKEFTLHRIISTEPLVTKGDNSLVNDHQNIEIIGHSNKGFHFINLLIANSSRRNLTSRPYRRLYRFLVICLSTIARHTSARVPKNLLKDV